MQLIEVTTPELAREFIKIQVDLYKNEPNYIRPLDKDIEEVFDPKKNKLFRNGQCIRWILRNDAGKNIGRVAAFINTATAKSFDQPTGGMGFFDCINDQIAAFKLFDTCKTWLQENGMEAMDGPINFGDRDKWWGLLVKEFSPASYGTNYNFPYYQELFEAYGFQLYFNQFSYLRKVKIPLDPKYGDRAQAILEDPDYTFEHMKRKEMAKYAEYFRVVYNKAWVKHQGVKEMSAAQAQTIMKKMKPIMDERIMWFAFYKGEPVGFFIGIPELNHLFKYVNGKLDLIGKLKFVYHRWRGHCKRATGIAFGIVPDHQKKGLEAGIVLAAANRFFFTDQVPYEDFLMNWIGDFNPKMMRVVENIGADIFKVHVTYRKLFDETKEFKRAPFI